jgi:hypothetical protein
MDKFEKFIFDLRKNTNNWLSFYGSNEIIKESINLPVYVEELIINVNKDILVLLNYLYNNFFDSIKKYI